MTASRIHVSNDLCRSRSGSSAAASPSADALAREFGPTQPQVRRLLRVLYEAYVAGKSGIGNVSQPVDLSDRVFVLHTYYALLLKLAAALIAGRLFGKVRARQTTLKRFRGSNLRRGLKDLEDGSLFESLGLSQFCPSDSYGWYAELLRPELEEEIAALVERLHAFEPLDPPTAGECRRDLFKKLHHDLLPSRLRHAAGEYYTPDWLAERLIRLTLGTARLGDPEMRILDPACGSGTFLTILIDSIRRRDNRDKRDRAALLNLILQNIVGCDSNPLAVLAAKTNYLFALGDLLEIRAGDLFIPIHQLDTVTGQLAEPNECRKRRSLPETSDAHTALLQPGSPGCGLFDCIVGNPPWINWEHLPADYRRLTTPLWVHYGLFPSRKHGMETILGAAKYDLSMLMTYVALDRYLVAGGKLGFVLSRSIWKTSGSGRGFRRFRLPDGTPFRPSRIEDLTALPLFEKAAARASIAVFVKGSEVRYPIPYRLWRKHTIGEAPKSRADWCAAPVDGGDPLSPWITSRRRALSALRNVLGPSDYRARAGTFTGGANGVFWLEALGELAGGRSDIRNFVAGAKRIVPEIRTTVETALVYPLLRGADVARWSARPSLGILLTHKQGQRLKAIPEIELQEEYPDAFAYLSRFEAILRRRAAYKRYFKSSAPYYSLFNIGDYSFAPWKVVWREQAAELTAAVVAPQAGRPVMPDHKLMMVAAASRDEAHYLCGALNSSAARLAVAAYTIEIQMDVHILTNVAIPQFNARNRAHAKLARLSAMAHRAIGNHDFRRIEEVEKAIDCWSAKLWKLTEKEMAEIAKSLQQRH